MFTKAPWKADIVVIYGMCVALGVHWGTLESRCYRYSRYDFAAKMDAKSDDFAAKMGAKSEDFAATWLRNRMTLRQKKGAK